jgi:hypothetical protein
MQSIPSSKKTHLISIAKVSDVQEDTSIPFWEPN